MITLVGRHARANRALCPKSTAARQRELYVALSTTWPNTPAGSQGLDLGRGQESGRYECLSPEPVIFRGV